MGDFCGSYDVHGLAVNVEAEAPLLLEGIESVLRPFAVAANGRDAYLLRVRYGAAPTEERTPPGLQRTWRGRHPNGIELICYVGEGTQQTDLMGLGCVRVNFTARQVDITVAEHATGCLPRGFLAPVLCSLLGRIGQHIVHAASVLTEVNSQPRALLLAGASGSGKTTTCLILAQAGMKLMADDASFVFRNSSSDVEPPKVWGLLLDCKVHDKTLKLLPWLEPFDRRPAPTPEEHFVSISQHIDVAQPTVALPAAVFCLEPPNDRRHEIQDMPKLEALSRMACETVRGGDDDSRIVAVEAFRTLTDLVSRCPTYRLSVGPDRETLAHHLVAQLEH